MPTTRYYFNLVTGQSPASLPLGSVWTQTHGASHKLVTAKRATQAELNQSALDTRGETDADYMAVGSQNQVVDAFPVGPISGGFKYVTKVVRSGSPNPIDLWVRFALYSPAGALRGVIFEGVPTSTPLPTAIATRVFTGTFTGNVVQQAGDILVVERGARATGAYTFWSQLDLPIRDSLEVPDLPEVDGSTAAGNPWLEIYSTPANHTTTRWYVNDVAPAASPAQSPVWTDIGTDPAVLKRAQLTTTRNTGASNINIGGRYFGTNPAGGFDAVGVQSVGPASLPAGPIRGSMRAVINRAADATGGGRDLFLHLIARVVSADGAVVRGTLANVLGQTKFASPESRTVFVPALTEVTAQAGDRLVVEWGARHLIGFSSAGGFVSGPSSVAVDSPFSDGNIDTGQHGWVEFTLENPPPNPLTPTGLDALPDVFSALISWEDPGGLPGPDEFDYRINGGAPVDVNLAQEVLVTGLTPETAYTFAVRARTNAGGVSAWSAPYPFTTLNDGFSNLRIGSVEAPDFAVGASPVVAMYLGGNPVLET